MPRRPSQSNCICTLEPTKEKWRREKCDVYLLRREHLYVFRKPATGEKMSVFKNSVKWR